MAFTHETSSSELTDCHHGSMLVDTVRPDGRAWEHSFSGQRQNSIEVGLKMLGAYAVKDTPALEFGDNRE